MAKAEVVTFHVRAIRYGLPVKGREHGTLDDAVADAYCQHDYGESARQEVWSGDECVLDVDAMDKRILEITTERYGGN